MKDCKNAENIIYSQLCFLDMYSVIELSQLISGPKSW